MYREQLQSATAWQSPIATASCSDYRRLRSDLIALGNDMLALWDLLVLPIVGYICALAYGTIVPAHDFLNFGGLAAMGGLLGPFILYDKQLATIVQMVRPMAIAARIAWRFSTLTGLLLAIGALTHVFVHTPRLWLIMWLVTSFVAVIGGRLLLLSYVRSMQQRGLLCERIAIVGAGPSAERLKHQLHRQRLVEIAGVFDQKAGETTKEGATGTLQDLLELGKRHGLDCVILTVASGGDILDTVVQLKSFDVAVALAPDMPGLDLSSGQLENFGGVPMLFLAHRPIRHWGLVLKALEDTIIGSLLLLLFFPLMLLVALAIRLDSPGPVLFRQKRTGFNNGEFEVFKFRTMRWDPNAVSGEKQTERGDSRVTRVGRWLRRTSLDELPQLLNVIRGEMSLVGPRPHPVAMRTQDRLGNEIMTEYGHRHRVKPGITGWAQIKGHRGAAETVDQVRRRVECDIFYIENWSILLDFKILALTPLKIVFDSGNAF